MLCLFLCSIPRLRCTLLVQTAGVCLPVQYKTFCNKAIYKYKCDPFTLFVACSRSQTMLWATCTRRIGYGGLNKVSTSVEWQWRGRKFTIFYCQQCLSVEWLARLFQLWMICSFANSSPLMKKQLLPCLLTGINHQNAAFLVQHLTREVISVVGVFSVLKTVRLMLFWAKNLKVDSFKTIKHLNIHVIIFE